MAASSSAAFYEVDARNIVPCRHASPKREYGAYTLRPKLRRLLPDFLVPFPRLPRHPYPWKGTAAPCWSSAEDGLRVAAGPPAIGSPAPGASAACALLRRFIREDLARYADDAGDPTKLAQSNLSPYLHFGQISAQRVATDVQNSDAPPAAKAAFLEQLIVRRELSDNFCLHTPDYDQASAFPAWASSTLDAHRRDRRPYRYTLAQFEAAETHDPLWNAAQKEMVKTGRMHGYMRMYWAKKILEWSESPEDALAVCILLNDRYELDGRDPNGYAGIAWSTGGVHDRAWSERPIFGKIRFMSSNGCRSKFKVDAYIRQVESA